MITVTESAANKVKQLLEAEGATDLALRVAVRPGGCSGFSYEMFFDGDVAADDETVTFGEIRVIVDPASSQLLLVQVSTTKMVCKMLVSRLTTRTQLVHVVVAIAFPDFVFYKPSDAIAALISSASNTASSRSIILPVASVI